MGSRSKLGRLSVSAFAPGADTTPGATRLTFAEWDHGCSTLLMDAGDVTGGHGSLDHILEHVVKNQIVVKPNGLVIPAVGEWRHWLPWILNHDAAVSAGEDPPALGGTTSTLAFSPADTLLLRNVHFDTDGSQRTYLAAGCGVAAAEIRCQSKGPVELDVRLEGRTYTEAVAFQPAAMDAWTNYATRFVHAEQAVVLASVTPTYCRASRIVIDNGVDNDRFFYGLTSAGPLMTDRRIGVELTIPFGLHSALWDAGIADAGVPLTVAYTYGPQSMTFSFPTVRASAEAWRSVVPRENFFTFRAMALRKLSATATPAVTCTLVTV